MLLSCFQTSISFLLQPQILAPGTLPCPARVSHTVSRCHPQLCLNFLLQGPRLHRSPRSPATLKPARPRTRKKKFLFPFFHLATVPLPSQRRLIHTPGHELCPTALLKCRRITVFALPTPLAKPLISSPLGNRVATGALRPVPDARVPHHPERNCLSIVPSSVASFVARPPSLIGPGQPLPCRGLALGEICPQTRAASGGEIVVSSARTALR